ncbi:unnamed protein product [Candidula unifasciata]|uniref:G-protein coupled receptors family 1 profile domain-containing protein n=1 Tax=Candidula unifasciata TaxID=100452 RepID=A0A8S3Z351_9EUPU|nr:unnamed protein product [Candidula unifasciata]
MRGEGVTCGGFMLMCGVPTIKEANTKGHFPLKGCHKDDTDLLSLLDDDDGMTWQSSLISKMEWDLPKNISNGNISQWMLAFVVDQFGAHNNTINVSHWRFHGKLASFNVYTVPKANVLEVPIRDIKSRLVIKIQIIERLFGEMSGVRKNAKEHFLIFETNIVSLSANVPNPKFLQFLKDSNIDFPIFDCGEEVGDRRYVSYKKVCDFVDHCSNKRDELLCWNLREFKYNGMFCASGQKLLTKEYMCDNVKHCRDGSDEENCFNKDCKSVRCQDGSCLPLQWVNDGHLDCFIYITSSSECTASDESFHENLPQLNNKSCVFSCNRDICIEESQLNDSVKDCKGPEGRLANTFWKLEPSNTCRNSHTLISDFTRQYFSPTLKLQTLDLRGILAQDIDDYLFHDLTISQTLYSDLFQICCPQIKGLIISPRACVAPVDVDAISSCANLIGLDIQRFLLWIVAILAVLGNVTIIVYRVIWDRSVLQTGYGLFVTNLGISDFIMGVYLLLIAGADSFYRDSYVLYDKTWRNSVVCKLASFMAFLSCEASTFFIFLITLDRFLVMKFPFGQVKFTLSHKTIAVVMSWVASFLLSLVPIVFNFDIYSSNAMCLGLPLTNTYARGWEYSVAVFIIFNLIMFVFIACGQYAIFRAMSENRISKTATNMPSSRRAEDITVAKQLSLVVLSNFLFWFPVGIMGLMSLGGHEVSSQVYAWTTVLLLPINSAANPVLYTIPALLERWQQFKRGG